MNNSDLNEEEFIVDLHTHSTFSDGSCTPTELVELAATVPNLKAVALTDHDSINGIEEFFEAGKRFPELELISGVEVSTLYGNKELHFVGLFVDHHNEELITFLDNLKKERLDRNILMAKKLFSLGYPIDYDELPYHLHVVRGRMDWSGLLCSICNCRQSSRTIRENRKNPGTRS